MANYLQSMVVCDRICSKHKYIACLLVRCLASSDCEEVIGKKERWDRAGAGKDTLVELFLIERKSYPIPIGFMGLSKFSVKLTGGGRDERIVGRELSPKHRHRDQRSL